MIYKLLRETEYMDLVVDGKTLGSPDDIRDGYIHFSTKETLAGTLEKWFKDEDFLYLLSVDEKRLDGLKWEEARGGILFPHLYGVLTMDMIEDTWEIEDHFLPKELP